MNNNIITMENITVSSEKEVILKRVNLVIHKGEKTALVGCSGSGKTTLINLLVGYVPSGLTCTEGDITVARHPVIKDGKLELNLKAVRKCISRIDQDPAASLTPTMTIRDAITELSPLPKQAALENGKKHLTLFDLPADDAFLNRYPSELSGGQRRRVAMARALSRNPDILLMDEPTVGLDCETQRIVVSLLKTLIEAAQASLILITHDLTVAEALCDRIVKMNHGSLQAATSSSETISALPFKTKAKPLDATPLLVVKNLCAKPPDCPQDVVKDLSFELFPKEALGVIGPSGAGKTTLVRTLLGLWPRTSGTVYLKQYLMPPTLKVWNQSIKGHIAWVSQDPSTAINPALKLGTSLKRAMKRAKQKHSEHCRNMDEVLHIMNLPKGWENRYPHQLSGGQLQRFAIARALVCDVDFLILDEVTSSLDAEMRDQICEMLNHIKKDTPMLVISHDQEVICRVCDRCISLAMPKASL